jgi:hypothetical protein
MSLLSEYIKFLVTEDPIGFVHDLSKLGMGADSKTDEEGRTSIFLDKISSKGIKRAFNDNADHQWLSTLDTIHWASPYDLAELQDSSKDELSTVMTLPGESFASVGGYKVGLWVRGRITLAANDQDNLYSGKVDTYKPGGPRGGTPEEYRHRKDSSGINKAPMVAKDYSRYGQLKKGTEFGEKMARENIPYVLDQSTWDPSKTFSGTNEALVDNWKPMGVVVTGDISKSVEDVSGNDPFVNAAGVSLQVFRMSRDFNVPIYDISRNVLWDPAEKTVKDEVIRRYIRNLLIEQEEEERTVEQKIKDLFFAPGSSASYAVEMGKSYGDVDPKLMKMMESVIEAAHNMITSYLYYTEAYAAGDFQNEVDEESGYGTELVVKGDGHKQRKYHADEELEALRSALDILGKDWGTGTVQTHDLANASNSFAILRKYAVYPADIKGPPKEEQAYKDAVAWAGVPS